MKTSTFLLGLFTLFRLCECYICMRQSNFNKIKYMCQEGTSHSTAEASECPGACFSVRHWDYLNCSSSISQCCLIYSYSCICSCVTLVIDPACPDLAWTLPALTLAHLWICSAPCLSSWHHVADPSLYPQGTWQHIFIVFNFFFVCEYFYGGGP